MYTADVFCDNCGRWIHGAYGDKPPAKSKARLTGIKAGWLYLPLTGKDICELCKGKIRSKK